MGVAQLSMTEYTSQGKTIPQNPVNLSNCGCHQSYYTCLSRSATASGTVIELLDEITKLRYEGQLPDHIQGNFKNPSIRAYQTWKGTNYVPELTDAALKWSAKDPLPLLPVFTDAPWQMIGKKQANKKKAKTGDAEVADDAPEVQSGFVAA